MALLKIQQSSFQWLIRHLNWYFLLQILNCRRILINIYKMGRWVHPLNFQRSLNLFCVRKHNYKIFMNLGKTTRCSSPVLRPTFKRLLSGVKQCGRNLHNFMVFMWFMVMVGPVRKMQSNYLAGNAFHLLPPARKRA